MKTDYTADAIRRQLWAMDCPRFDIAMIHEADGPGGRVIWQRDLKPAEVMHRKGYLASQNAQGIGIFIQPARGTDRALVLIDDIEDTDALAARGVDPCAVIETSQSNFQAWVDLGEPMPPTQRHAVAHLLVREFDGDLGAVGALHLGRLAGFRNHKPHHADATGKGPWVLARHSKPGVCSKAAAIRAWAARNAPVLPGTPDSDLAPVQTSKSSPEGNSGAAEAFARALDNARDHCERMAADDSLADFAATCSCLRQGYAPGDIQAALQASIEASPDRLHKHHNPADYARRTVRKATEEVAKERARSMGARDL